MRDISGGGLQFKNDTPLKKDTRLGIKIDLLDGSEPILSEAIVVWCTESSPRDIYSLEIPMGATVDFQVEAMIGGIYSQGIWFGAGDAFEGEVSGWSETQTLTITEFQTPSPSPEPTSSLEPALILGVFAILAVFVFGLVLLYRIKRK